jgi:hypothetical protein
VLHKQALDCCCCCCCRRQRGQAHTTQQKTELHEEEAERSDKEITYVLGRQGLLGPGVRNTDQ